MRACALRYHVATLRNPAFGLALYKVDEAELGIELERHLVEASAIDGLQSGLAIAGRMFESAGCEAPGRHRQQLCQPRMLTLTRACYEFFGPRTGLILFYVGT